MFCMQKKYILLFSKHSSNFEKQVILIMISNGEKGQWHYLAAKKLLALLKEITSKHVDFYPLNCFHSFTTEKQTSVIFENKDFLRL